MIIFVCAQKTNYIKISDMKSYSYTYLYVARIITNVQEYIKFECAIDKYPFPKHLRNEILNNFINEH